VTRSVLHLADIHLEASFAASGLPASVGARRREDLRAALSRALLVARKRQVDAVTVAGDLYDGRYALPELGGWLASALASLAPIPVIIAPGCTDPCGEDGLYALTHWPDNVTILPPGPLSAVRVAPDLTIWGSAWRPEGWDELPSVPASPSERHLLLLHSGGPVGEDGGPAMAGLRADAVRAAGYDLALLGGSHMGGLWPADDPCGCFPGSPEPLTPDEAASRHGAALVEIPADGSCAVEWLDVGRWRYVSLVVDLAACAGPKEAARRIEAALKHDRVRTDPRAIVTVTVTSVPEDGLDLVEVQGLIETRAQVMLRAQRPLAYDLERLAQEQTVRGLLVRRLRAEPGAGQPSEGELRRRALNLALRALDGKGVRPGEVA